MNTVLEINNLSLYYQDQMIVKDLNLSLESGEVIAIVGYSGSGKSTILKALLNYEQHQEINSYVKPSYMSQTPLLLSWLTVAQNLELPFSLNRKIKLPENYEKLIEQFKITDILTKYPHQISGGQKSRVSLLMLYLLNNQLFLLDEPLAALDQLTKEKILETFERVLKKNKVSVIYVTHDLLEAIKISDKILVLAKSPTQVVSQIDVKASKVNKTDIELRDEILRIMEANDE